MTTDLIMRVNARTTTKTTTTIYERHDHGLAALPEFTSFQPKLPQQKQIEAGSRPKSPPTHPITKHQDTAYPHALLFFTVVVSAV